MFKQAAAAIAAVGAFAVLGSATAAQAGAAPDAFGPDDRVRADAP